MLLLLLAVAFGLAFVHNHAAPPAPTAWAVPGTLPDAKPARAAIAQPLQAQSQFVSARPGAAVHAASLVELKEGQLRAVWFSGSREGASDVTVQTAVLGTAPGAGWSLETTLLTRQQIQQGLLRYVKKIGNPVIARAPDGSLRLYLVTVSLGGWAGSAITTLRSDDDGSTWQKPQRLVTSPFLNISTLVKGAPSAWADGSTALPVYHEFITKMGEVLRLAPDGTVRDKIRIPGSQRSLQPVILVGSASEAQVWMRSNTATALMQSATNDAGTTWQPTQPGAWPNPDSALAGVVASDGSQWLAINPLAQGRSSLVLLQTPAGGDFALGRAEQPVREIAVEPVLQRVSPAAAASTASANASASAPAPRMLSSAEHRQKLRLNLLQAGVAEPEVAAFVASAERQLCHLGSDCREEFSYPFLLQSRDGAVHLLYTWHRSRIRHVRLASVAVEAVLPNAPKP